MTIKKLFYIAASVCAASLLIGAVGDAFKAVMTDAAGNVVSTPLSFSNNVTLNATPAAAAHLARMQDITNATVVTLAVTNVTGDTSILVTGTRVKALAWTNANAYVTMAVTNGLAPAFTGSSTAVTNLFDGVTNVLYFGNGILTNKTTL